eukprot:gnl/TRDRNA2_/TRDRNA2_182665_c0_seq1.p1 gnl/TRDRNA2_/TRDRNA2_182665_c0~~gnl/TRDRNA2_/TRDRNA2_182665_c0_seq1.p1  ORF type:complete len:409 (-),score=76.91 gnl/TRDRNA2_/TRDRNA2_182665_c0_seq1:363-1589(-)
MASPDVPQSQRNANDPFLTHGSPTFKKKDPSLDPFARKAAPAGAAGRKRADERTLLLPGRERKENKKKEKLAAQFLSGTKDRLLERADRILNNSFGEPVLLSRLFRQRVDRAVFLTALPFAMFASSLAATCFFLHTQPFLTEFLICVMVFVSLCIWNVSTKKWARQMGVLCCVAVIIGLLAGTVVYLKHLIFFYSYDDFQHYTNVIASQPSPRFADASMLYFASSTRLDTSRAVGYKASDTGTTFCVAPIVDSSLGLEQDINYFAVGIDCCAARGHFVCDGAASEATASLVVLNPDMVFEPITAWLVNRFSDFPKEDYHRAIELDEAVFGMHAADKIQFLRWTPDPHGTLYTHWRNAEKLVKNIAIAYFIMSSLLGIILAFGEPEPRAAKLVKQLPNVMTNVFEYGLA